MHDVFQFLADRPIIVLFLLLGVGSAVGRIRIAGVSLGAVAVLFAGMGLSAAASVAGVDLALPAVVGDVGVVIFTFCVGVAAGPGFVNALRSSWGMLLAVAGILVAGAGTALLLGRLWGLDAAGIAGTFAGAVTSTASLAGISGGADATVGYASTYVFGVVGALLVVGMALRHRAGDTDAPAPIVGKTVRIDAQETHTAGDLARRFGGLVTFSRVRLRGGTEIRTVADDTELPPGAVVTVVGPQDAVAQVTAELGHTSTIDITRDRSQLDYRRIILSKPALAGRTVASLRLPETYGATIVRVRRGDVEFVGTGDFVLHQGDRLRVVGPGDQLRKVSAYLGDSERGMADINPLAIGIGLTIGLLLGSIEIPLPGGGHFSLGYAAGALFIGLVFGRLGRIGPMLTSLPNTAGVVLGELGLLLFLAAAGTTAGELIVAALASGVVLGYVVVGAVVTTVVMLGGYLVLRHLFHLGGTRLSGVLAGTQTNSAILAFANARTGHDPRVALGYSLLYPAAIVVKILLAQLLVLL
ncbi:transporter [Microbacterium sp. W1N]|uniref:aspartate:alanine exchanger family transporter n=1 Tax=Microbacterium festucae TaxID=2977531 RepID=UPI0021C140A3|nr:TrkA C-terminal domain-containing protein [Microbacterium festucae]MCT9818925.1 transporter [Microbacterium festucae]